MRTASVFDPIEQFRQHRFDVLADVAGHDDMEEVVAGLQGPALCFNDYFKDSLVLQILLAERLNFFMVGVHLEGGHQTLIGARPVADHTVVDQDHSDIVDKLRSLFQFLYRLANVHNMFLFAAAACWFRGVAPSFVKAGSVRWLHYTSRLGKVSSVVIFSCT